MTTPPNCVAFCQHLQAQPSATAQNTLDGVELKHALATTHMILLNIMANVARPVLRQTKLSFSPVAPPARDDAHSNKDKAHVSTRRTTTSSPLLALADNEQPVRQAPTIDSTPSRPAPPARISSRKRPAAALEPDATDTRPPTKITVTYPHGDLVRTTNGVAAPLRPAPDDVPSSRSTPRPRSAGKLQAPAASASAPTSTSQDKRSLRSHDGGSRLKSDLAVYFGNYDDIIAGLPKQSGGLSVSMSRKICC